MCQIKEQPIGEGPVTGYRIYERRFSDKEEYSYFNSYARLDLNVKIAAANKPFHACRSIEDVESMLAYCNGERDFVVVYRCELSGDVQSGLWSDTGYSKNPTKTYTGKFCMLLEEVQLQSPGNQAT